MYLVKVISTELDSLKRRIVKILRNGRFDVATAIESGPWGIDSNPPKNMIAVYSPTSINGREVIVGYINKNQLAGPGESRTYSVDSFGVQKFYTWIKNDGTYEIGGNSDNAVRYAKLNTALQAEVSKINAELQKINVAIVGLGGTYAVTPISLDISESKIAEVKTL